VTFTLEPIVPTPDEFRELRTRAGLSQAQLARLLMTTVDRVKKYERGRHPVTPQLWLLTRITCDALARAQWHQQLPKEDT
jgi:DNA-binding transcriptional regulator YiaG